MCIPKIRLISCVPKNMELIEIRCAISELDHADRNDRRRTKLQSRRAESGAQNTYRSPHWRTEHTSQSILAHRTHTTVHTAFASSKRAAMVTHSIGLFASHFSKNSLFLGKFFSILHNPPCSYKQHVYPKTDSSKKTHCTIILCYLTTLTFAKIKESWWLNEY